MMQQDDAKQATFAGFNENPFEDLQLGVPDGYNGKKGRGWSCG